MKKRQDIQNLRALSVIAVVFFHLWPRNFPNGYLGVDAFFVISGFVVGPLINNLLVTSSNNREVIKNFTFFLWRRFLRLFPAFFVMILVTSFLVFFLVTPEIKLQFFKQSLYSQFLLGNLGSYRITGDYFQPTINPLLHTWSLSVEEQIYILICLTGFFLFSLKMRKEAILRRISITFILVSIITFELLDLESTRSFIQDINSFGYYFTGTRLWEFAIGCLLATINPQIKKRLFRKTDVITATGLIIVLFTAVKFGIIAGPIIVVSLTTLLLRSGDYQIQRNRLLGWIGDRSYSIYLYHLPILTVFLSYPIFKARDTLRPLLELSGLAFTLLLAHLSYMHIETKISMAQKRDKKLLLTNQVLFLGIASLCLSLVGLMGTQTTLRNSKISLLKANLVEETPFNCQLKEEKTSFCKVNHVGNTDKGKFLLLGDSHALQLSRPFREFARKKGVNADLIVNLGCPLIFGDGTANSSIKCQVSNIDTLRILREHHYDYIIFSEMFREEIPLNIRLHTLRILQLLSAHTIYVLDTPHFPDRTMFLANLPIWSTDYVPRSNFKLSEMAFVKDKANFEKNLKILGISSINLTNVFCKQKTCYRGITPHWYFVDDNHLSRLGIDLVLDQFVSQLSSLGETDKNRQ